MVLQYSTLQGEPKQEGARDHHCVDEQVYIGKGCGTVIYQSNYIRHGPGQLINLKGLLKYPDRIEVEYCESILNIAVRDENIWSIFCG